MAYGIQWYEGVGEHDYKETRSSEFESMRELLESLSAVARTYANDDLLFEALEGGPQEVIYWVTDDFGFAFYRPS
jgi:hypothetical protein